MSRSLSIFVDNSCTFAEFASSLEQILHVSFVKEQDKPWPSAYFSGLGLTVRLVNNLDYEDDLEIAFSRYSYQIHIDMYTRVQEEKYWLGLEYYMTMYIYSRIREILKWKCIVVEDMQRLLARN